MKSHRSLLHALVAFSILVSSAALAVDPPGILNHQGRIVVSGANYTGTGHFKFVLVDAAGTGTLWSNDGAVPGGGQPLAAVAVTVSQGHYALGLGDTTLPGMTIPIPASTFTANAVVRLRIWFSTNAGGPFEQLTPDRRITSAGYALSAARAEFAQAAGMITTGVVSNPSFFGTTNIDPLDLSVNNQRALRLEIQSAGAAPNLIGGFSGNSIAFGANGAVIAGGGSFGNANSITAAGGGATIAGGAGNTASNTDATIGGGAGNTASGLQAVVAGGSGNTASQGRSTVGGGLNNAASGGGAVVSGGSGNVASGSLSTVPGGESNTAGQSYTFAAGRRAKALNQGAFVWADSQDAEFSSTAVDQFNVRAAGGARLFTGGTGLKLDSDSVVFSGSTQTGRFGGAAGLDFNTGDTANGFGTLLEQGLSESSGIYFDGDCITLWSPGDNPGNGTRLLRILDEDDMSVSGGAAAAEKFYIDGSGGVFSAGNVTAAGAVISGTTQTASLAVGSGTFSTLSAVHVISSVEPTVVVESATISSPGILVKNPEARWFTGIDRPSRSWVVIHQNAGATRLKIDVNGDIFGKSFNPTSDRDAKENFAPVNPRKMLEQVAALPITRWNFKGDTDTPHIGPVAQDFHAAFGVGPDDKHIATVDADGVALAAIQGLNLKLEEELKTTRAENNALKERLGRLEHAVETMQRPAAVAAGNSGSN